MVLPWMMSCISSQPVTANEPAPESLEQLTEATAAALAQAAAHSAFHLFRDKHFRRAARFEELDTVEQDRIFNELVCASLVLIMLVLEAPDLRGPRELRGYQAELKEKLPKAYIGQLKTYGVQNQHLKDWEKLIAMRYEEYAGDRHDVRAAAMQIESSEKDLDLKDLSKIQMMVPLQAVAIGCHYHICRGKTDDRDKLFKSILRSLSEFYVRFRVLMEGGRSTPWMRARMAVRRVLGV